MPYVQQVEGSTIKLDQSLVIVSNATYFDVSLLHNQTSSTVFDRGTHKDTFNQGLTKTLDTYNKYCYSHVATSSSAIPQDHLPVYANNYGVVRKDINENGAGKKLENGSGSYNTQLTDEMAANKNTNVQSKRQCRNRNSNNRKTGMITQEMSPSYIDLGDADWTCEH